MLIGNKPCLCMHATGLEICTWMGTKRIEWLHIRSIEIGHIKGTRALFIHLADEHSRHPRIHRVTRRLGIADYTIVDIYEHGPKSLAKLMNEYIAAAAEASRCSQVRSHDVSKSLDL